MYKVFYNDRAINLIEKSEKIPVDLQKMIVDNRRELYQFLDDYFHHHPMHDIAVTGYELSGMFSDFKSWFKYIEAAGGLVKNTDGKHLFIYRWDMWDLPKGKIENNEPIESAAIREVEEETGIDNVKIQAKLPVTYHIYRLDYQMILKCTYWFLMSTSDSKSPNPQLDEGITEAVWLNKEQSRKALTESYRSLKETLISIF